MGESVNPPKLPKITHSEQPAANRRDYGNQVGRGPLNQGDPDSTYRSAGAPTRSCEQAVANRSRRR